MFLPSFFIAFFGMGALVTAVVTAIVPELSLNMGIAIFMISSLGLLILLRKKFVKVLKGDIHTDEQSDYIGFEGDVFETISAGSRGKIKMSGTFWEATSDQDLSIGQRVVITATIPNEPTSFIVSLKS